MCGIAGYASLGSGQSLDPHLIDRMLQRLHHRGPDDRGSAAWDKVVFGNTRLAIIDIAHGHQPIANEDGSVVIVYNGELYNAPELRKELERNGHVFSTRTDTEVLVHLYEQEGDAFVKRLNGMFTFALYDIRGEKLLIGRDRFGVKPLVYSHTNGILSFASEIKALREVPGIDWNLRPEGLSTYLGLFYIPDPWTAFRGVHSLKPGHFIRLSRAGLEIERYADLDFRKKAAISRDEAEEQTAALLTQSVKRQLLSDVPVGVMLSGGLDSRSLLYLADKELDEVSSFTITFAEGAFNEGGAAETWAKMVGSKHHTYQFTADDFCDHYLARQKHLDQPYALWCNVASARMAAYINRQGYKVVLGGDGGDELFLGYPTIHATQAARLYRLLPEIIRSKMITPIVNNLPAGSARLPLTFMMKSFVGADHPDLFRTFFGFKEVVRYRDWPSLLTPEALKMIGEIDPFIAFDQYRKDVEGFALVDALDYFDFKVFLPGSCLFGNDNAFMEASVELRVPFLDNDLADFAASLPVDIRFDLLKTKPVLRNALANRLLGRSDHAAASAELQKYRKAGFEVPGNAWMVHPRFRNLLLDTLSPARLKRTGFFRPEPVAAILEDQFSGRQNNERILQAICSMVLFLDRNGG
jgi:asparagine synthase (glutamine-hydrolysing)